MTTVAVAPTGTAAFPDGGGHWWVYLQYVLGLRDLGCRVIWLERCRSDLEPWRLDQARKVLSRWGFSPDEIVLYADPSADPDTATGADGGAGRVTEIDLRSGAANGLDWPVDERLSDVELLLNFDYDTPQSVLDAAECSVLVDIDPGLMQVWWSGGLINPGRHDLWVTTGETVGTRQARFPDCGVRWHHVPPSVHLPSWLRSSRSDHGVGSIAVQGSNPDAAYTTVTSWWGREWLKLGDGTVLDNNKRAAFLAYADLPSRTRCRLEVAAYFGEPEPTTPDRPEIHRALTPVAPEYVGGDADDVALMAAAGWSLRRSREVAGTPEAYRRYVLASRGEFSCAKPSCLLLANAWISDRTLCYLAAGRPAVVEYTGPSHRLQTDAGLVRFQSMEEAVDGLAMVEYDYGRHSRTACEFVEAGFSVIDTLNTVLNLVPGSLPIDPDLDHHLAPGSDRGGGNEPLTGRRE